jgi:tripartite-type tricarboxylate transporter receptor subunit TctC
MDLLCLVSKTPPVLVVRDNAPWTTFAEFLEAARAEPGGLIMANSGTGSIWHFNTLLMEQVTGIRVTHVPYGGSSGSLASLLGGHVDAVIAGAGEAVGNVSAGQLRVLTVLDAARSRLYPEAPTTRELGYAFGAPAWSGFYAPKGIPPQVRRRLEPAFQKAFQSEAWTHLCKERGMEAVYMDGGHFQEFALEQAAFFEQKIPVLLRMER